MTSDGASPLEALEVDDDDRPDADKQLEEDLYVFDQMANDYGILDANGSYPGVWSDPFCLRDFSKATLRKMGPRVVIGLSVFLIGLYVNNLSQAWLQRNIAGYYADGWSPNPPKQNASLILWDVTFKMLPHVHSTAPGDALANFCGAITMLRFVVLPGPMSMRWTFICRLGTVWGILWFCRGLTIITTPLPNPDLTCKPRLSFPDNIFLEAYANMPIAVGYDELTCEDLLFSGHTTGSTLNFLFFMRYTKLAPWFRSSASGAWWSTGTAVNIGCICHLVVTYYFIVASHFHYTVDVLVAVLMTVGVFKWYHSAIEVVCLQEWKSRLPFKNFLRWFEEHAEDLRVLRRQVFALARLRKNSGMTFVSVRTLV